jgi:predicted dehydrogenase
VRVALYGADEPAGPYIDALARRPDIELIAVCDADRRAAEQIAAGWAAGVYAKFPTLLSETNPEAVWICAPPQAQGEAVLECALRAIPFFVVPPGCSDFERARACFHTLQSRPLVTAVGYPVRLTDIFLEAGEYLRENKVVVARGCWVGQPAQGGSQEGSRLLWTDACVLIDALRLLVGEATEVRTIKSGDTAVQVQIAFEGGATADLTCAAFDRPSPRVDLEVLAANSTLTFREELTRMELEEADRTTILRQMNRVEEKATSAFLEAVQESKQELVSPSFADAFRTLAVCQAALRSIEEQRVVPVSEFLQQAPKPDAPAS